MNPLMNIGEAAKAAGVSAKMIRNYEQIAELISMWGDDARSSREVKAVAQRHLDELEEKMREITEMKNALQHMVNACKGDDHAHCAILDTLAVDSPAAPQHHAHVVKTRRRDGERADSAAKKTSTGPGSHIDLMACMRGVATAHGH